MTRFLLVVTGILFVLTPASGAPLPGSTFDKLVNPIMEGWNAARMGGTYADAIKWCRDAEKLTAGFDRDPFADGLVASCYAAVERFKGSKPSACNYYLRAIRSFEAVPAGHREFGEAGGMAEKMRNDRKQARC
jgi:hypothetical protein